MRGSTRIAVAAAVTAAALAGAGSALASYGPKLVVGGAPNGQTRIGVVVGAADDATARATIYVPSGYTVGTPAPGTRLGTVTATASAAALAGAVLPLSGELDAIAPTAATTAVAQACGVAPAQTWNLHVSAAGQALDIPLFVVAPTAPEAAAGFGTKLVVCLAAPQDSPFGAKLLSATFTASAITAPASAGDYRWTSVWTPYATGTAQPNVPATVETQALQRLPAALTTAVVRKRIVTSKTVKVHGRKKKVKVVVTAVAFASEVTENGKAAASSTITTTSRGKKLGGAKGAFLMSGLKSTRVTVSAAYDSDSGTVPTGVPAQPSDLAFHDLGAASCTATALFGGVPCIDATLGGGRVTESVVVRAYTK